MACARCYSTTSNFSFSVYCLVVKSWLLKVEAGRRKLESKYMSGMSDRGLEPVLERLRLSATSCITDTFLAL